jgi:hypothetical protein
LLNEYHIKFLYHLVEREIAFLIIGGQARHFLDSGHQTNDLDIWVRLHPEDIVRLEEALVAWAKEHPQHAINQGLVPPLRLRPGVQIKLPETDGVWFLDRHHNPREVGTKDGIDVLTSLCDLDFDECMRRATRHDAGGIAVFSLCHSDLDCAPKKS